MLIFRTNESLKLFSFFQAKQAELISMTQLRLSSIYSDPNLRARCLIYLSHSWCQQGQRLKAIYLIKHYLYPFLLELGKNSDKIVAQMYKSLCFRVRFIYNQKYNRLLL